MSRLFLLSFELENTHQNQNLRLVQLYFLPLCSLNTTQQPSVVTDNYTYLDACGACATNAYEKCNKEVAGQCGSN
jgi:hypothetical protein